MGEDLAPPGWFPDPSGRVGERYWDGSSWSSEIRDYPPPVVATTGTEHNAKGQTLPAEVVLTQDQLRIIDLMAKGMTNGQIARVLALSEATVRTATLDIYDELDVKGRAQAVEIARSRGLIA